MFLSAPPFFLLLLIPLHIAIQIRFVALLSVLTRPIQQTHLHRPLGRRREAVAAARVGEELVGIPRRRRARVCRGERGQGVRAEVWE